MGNKDGDAITRGGCPGLQQGQQGHIATTLTVMPKLAHRNQPQQGTRRHQSAQTWGQQHWGVEVEECGMVCWFVEGLEEGGGECTGGGCSSRCLIVLSCRWGKKFCEGYKVGNWEVLVVVSPAVGMGILSIVVHNGVGAGIVSKEDVWIVTVQWWGKTVGGVYWLIFDNDAGCEPGGREQERSWWNFCRWSLNTGVDRTKWSWCHAGRFPTGFIGICTTLYGIANIAKSGCTMKVGIPDGKFGVHKTKKGWMLKLECAWRKCFQIYQELQKTHLNDVYDYQSLPKIIKIHFKFLLLQASSY